MDLSQISSSANGGTNNPESKDAEDSNKQNLNQVINSIDKTLGLLHQLHLTVSSFNVASQLPLLQRVNSLVTELDTMQRVAENCNVQIPMEIVNLIDDGKNPDEFNRDVLNSCIAKNQITKGKTDAFKAVKFPAFKPEYHIVQLELGDLGDLQQNMRRFLLEELDQAFPNEVETYREIRASSAAESKRLAQAQSILPNGDAKVKMEH